MSTVIERINQWQAYKLNRVSRTIAEAAVLAGISQRTAYRYEKVQSTDHWRQKWDSMIRTARAPTAERDARLVEWVTANPGLTTRSVAEKFGIKGDLVIDIVRRSGVAALVIIGGQRRCAAGCGDRARNGSRYCHAHKGGKPRPTRMIQMACGFCETIFERPRSQVRPLTGRHAHLRFCGKRCQGLWLGKHFNPRSRKGAMAA